MQRLTQAKDAEEFRFAIVEDEPTERYVQFGSRDITGFEADFPIGGATSPHEGDRVRTGRCSTEPIRLAPGEKAHRNRSRAEERRLTATLDELKLQWIRLHCIQKDVKGRRTGFITSIVVPLRSAAEAPPFVERIFADVYRLEKVGRIVITTDE